MGEQGCECAPACYEHAEEGEQSHIQSVFSGYGVMNARRNQNLPSLNWTPEWRPTTPNISVFLPLTSLPHPPSLTYHDVLPET